MPQIQSNSLGSWSPILCGAKSRVPEKRTWSLYLLLVARKPVSRVSDEVKPLSHWDVTSSRWVRESIRQTVANCRKTFAWYPKVLACIANFSRTVRQSFKHVIFFCATKIIAKPSPSHHICREPVANLSPTLRRGSQTHRKEVSAICTMRQICDINKTLSRLNCEK